MRSPATVVAGRAPVGRPPVGHAGADRPATQPTQVTADRVYASVAGLAVAMAVVHGPRTPLVLTCLAVAALPWLLLVTGRDLPVVVFTAAAIAPVVPVVVVAGPGAVVFCTTIAASHTASRTGSRWLLVVVAVVVAAVPFASYADHHGDVGAVYFAFGSVFGLLVGVLLRLATRLADDLRVADARLAEAAARQERQRIARDVHDLVAHSLTVVVLRVGGARRVLRSDPARAEEALADAERVCRESLDGIRGVVGLLREDAGDPPVLSLDLGELADGFRAAGLDVDLDLAGDPATLPLVVRVALHHVVQEALANAARHSGGRSAAVRVTVDAAGVTARIANARRDAPAPPRGSGGYGLVGLHERVTALGGRLSGGPEGEEWLVSATLPVRARP